MNKKKICLYVDEKLWLRMQKKAKKQETSASGLASDYFKEGLKKK